MNSTYQMGGPTVVIYKRLWPTSADVRIVLKFWLLQSTDVCIGHCGHRHFIIGHLFHKYAALTVLETKFVSNERNNRSVQYDNENSDNDIHDSVQN